MSSGKKKGDCVKALMIGFVLLLSGCASLDKGNFGAFQRSLNTTSYGYDVIVDPTGEAPTDMVEVFDVRPGDCGVTQGWSDCVNDRERSELSERSKSTGAGSEFWYGWSLYFPEDYPDIYPTKVALGQFHQPKSHVVWMFQQNDKGYQLDQQVWGMTSKYYTLIDAEALRGRWHQIEVNARWSKDSTGFMKVYVNGELKADYSGQTMTAQAVYFKYGLYRSFMGRYKSRFNTEQVPAQKVYFAHVRRANSRAELQASGKN